MTHDEENELEGDLAEYSRKKGWWRRNRTRVIVAGIVVSCGALFISSEIRSANERERDRKLLRYDDQEWIAMSGHLQDSGTDTAGAKAHLTIKAGEENALVEVRDGDGKVFMVTSIGAGETAVMRAPEGEWTVRLKEGTAAKESREMMSQMRMLEDLAYMQAYEERLSRREQAEDAN